MKRWVVGGIAAGVVVVLALFGRSGTALGESCGLGLPPGAPGFTEAQAREEADGRKNGFRRVCAANLRRYDISFETGDAAIAGLAFEPVDLAGTGFAQMRSLGATAEAVNETKSRLYRGFRTPEGHAVTLFEHDMSADGSRAWRDPQLEPERINGLPARLLVMQTGAGKALSHLSWTEGRRGYELWIDANVATQAKLREMLFALAASLPASKPACPNEPKLDSVKLGPDGLPDIPSPPTILLEEEKRPCK